MKHAEEDDPQMCDHGLPVKLFVPLEKQIINLFKIDIEI
jgi:hypothetical protein